MTNHVATYLREAAIFGSLYHDVPVRKTVLVPLKEGHIFVDLDRVIFPDPILPDLDVLPALYVPDQARDQFMFHHIVIGFLPIFEPARVSCNHDLTGLFPVKFPQIPGSHFSPLQLAAGSAPHGMAARLTCLNIHGNFISPLYGLLSFKYRGTVIERRGLH
ncbi:hypothetical protein ES703_49323 [subsurface metagenome]